MEEWCGRGDLISLTRSLIRSLLHCNDMEQGESKQQSSKFTGVYMTMKNILNTSYVHTGNFTIYYLPTETNNSCILIWMSRCCYSFISLLQCFTTVNWQDTNTLTLHIMQTHAHHANTCTSRRDITQRDAHHAERCTSRRQIAQWMTAVRGRRRQECHSNHVLQVRIARMGSLLGRLANTPVNKVDV